MPDPIFAHPRLAALYDLLDGARDDLEHYVAIAAELGARTVVDVGCGTGSFACRLAERGYEVVGIDPAEASLAIARAKPHADRVQWILGDGSARLNVQADLVTMTGNVAQVFLDDDDWHATLRSLRAVLVPDGWLVFETRDPAAEAWTRWDRAHTFAEHLLTDGKRVRSWTELGEVALPYVSFRHHYDFGGGDVLVSDSTLRFRTIDELHASLAASGFALRAIRDAPDRPGLEFVVLAQAI